MSSSMFRKAMLSAALAVSLSMPLAAFVGLISSPAVAQTAAEKAAVDAAKARGLIGEQGDGYLGFVTPSTDPMLAAAVAAINAGRMQVYRETAMRTGVTVEAAGQATAQQLFARLPPGQFFKPLNGDWTRKT
jgi:uncharacterized protein YdbL (DUF1318 family)